jgi:hypothetical protein
MATTKKAPIKPSKAPVKARSSRPSPPPAKKGAAAGSSKRPAQAPLAARPATATKTVSGRGATGAAHARPAKAAPAAIPSPRSKSMSEATKPSEQGSGSTKNRAADTGDLSTGNLDKVRDILFGAQARDTDKRFSKLEERLGQEFTDLREETKKRFDALESFVRSELESLSQRLKTEQTERTTSAKDLAHSIKETSDAIGSRISQLDEETASRQRDLRQQILDQSKSLSDDIRQRSDQLTSTMNREVRDLQNDKTDRAALAALFTEMAMRLNNEFHFPGEE